MQPFSLSLGIPKGRLETSICKLLGDIGMEVRAAERSYRPFVGDPNIKAKILKPRDIVNLVGFGALDAGFAGLDLVQELGADVVLWLDTGMDPVRIVSAVPENFPDDLKKLGRNVLAVTEYKNLAGQYLAKKDFPNTVLQTSGATEVFPPEDADMIIDNCSTGVTLKANHLKILDVLLESSTLFIVSRKALDDPFKQSKLEDMRLLILSVLEARKRVVLEMNVSREKLDALVGALPSMKSPTIQPLYSHNGGVGGFAVKIVVEKKKLGKLIPKIKALGATDIIQYQLDKVIP